MGNWLNIKVWFLHVGLKVHSQWMWRGPRSLLVDVFIMWGVLAVLECRITIQVKDNIYFLSLQSVHYELLCAIFQTLGEFRYKTRRACASVRYCKICERDFYCDCSKGKTKSNPEPHSLIYASTFTYISNHPCYIQPHSLRGSHQL